MLRLYLDEDVPESIARGLRLRGYDVLTTMEAGNKGLPDAAQQEYATRENRVLLTHNIADFCRIHYAFVEQGRVHPGIILAKQVALGTLVRSLLQVLSSIEMESMRGTILWLSEWIQPE